MGALLASIGIKDYLYGATIVALVGGFVYYTHHERVIGADEALAPVAVLAQKAQVQVAVAAAVATSTETDNAKQYTAAVAAPAPAPVGIVCQREAPRSSVVPQADAGSSAPAGQPAVDTGVGPAFDPSGAILERARQADAQVTYLQQRVRELESQMESSP